MLRNRNAIVKPIKIKNVPSTDKRRKRCGLCGATDKIIKTKCCNNYICDAEVSYMFDDGSCYHKHYGLTICGHHYAWKHEGEWQNCQKCRNSLMTERYVWYGTNNYNFTKLETPPTFEPNNCCTCGIIIKIGQESYWVKDNNYYCFHCATLNHYPLLG
jgi:hypothetical protein